MMQQYTHSVLWWKSLHVLATPHQSVEHLLWTESNLSCEDFLSAALADILLSDSSTNHTRSCSAKFLRLWSCSEWLIIAFCCIWASLLVSFLNLANATILFWSSILRDSHSNSFFFNFATKPCWRVWFSNREASEESLRSFSCCRRRIFDLF